jgi:uncharacterized protein YkwD
MKTQSVLFFTLVCLILMSDSGSAEERAPPAYLSALESKVLSELNLARSDPQLYADYLQEMRRFFRGTRLERPGEIIIVTKEGAPAVEEAIAYLRSLRPLQALVPSPGMSLAAKVHARDQRGGAVGHTGSDGSQPPDRMNRYGAWRHKVAENIAYGGRSARGVIVQLIVDDGVPDRGHRMNIFDPEYSVVGVGCGPHARFGDMCVIDFAAGYVERPREDAP